MEVTWGSLELIRACGGGGGGGGGHWMSLEFYVDQ